MIGKILADRYQITEVRDSGRVLVAEDTHRPGYPLCLIQRLQGAASNPQGFQIAKLILEQRVEAIGRLGKFSQIPAVLTFFELDQGLYLLEEMVMGHPLSQELIPGTPWSEAQTCELMRELLEMLIYMHQHDVILRGLRPDNLIRRQTDGKLVIVNLLLLPPRGRSLPERELRPQALPMDNALEVSHLYMPPEQLQGNPIFNSNLYSLGMIALQALTGLPPTGLPEIKSHWHDRINVSPKFRALLDRILANETRDRYRSAKEALKVLQQVSEEEPQEDSPALFIPTRPHHPPVYHSPQEETVATVDLAEDLERDLDLEQDLLRSLTRSPVKPRSEASEPVPVEAPDLRTSDIVTSESTGSQLAAPERSEPTDASADNSHHLSRDFAPAPTVLNPTPLSSLILETQPPQPIAPNPIPLLNGQPSESSLPVTQIQPKPWWRSKRIWGGLGLLVGAGSLLAWHLRLPQGALSAYHLNQGQEKSSRSQYKGAIAQFNEALSFLQSRLCLLPTAQLPPVPRRLHPGHQPRTHFKFGLQCPVLSGQPAHESGGSSRRSAGL
jgi:serine/threonine protein kinase